MRISLNLASRPYADIGPALKQLRIAMAVLAVAALGLGLGLRAFHVKAEEAREREHSLDGAIERVKQDRLGYEQLMRQPANAELLTRIGALNELFGQKTFSWTLAMEDLETVLPAGVQVNNLEPVRDKDGSITLHLRVVGPRDRAIELMRNLERSKHFLRPRMVGENAESGGGPGERLEPISASNRVAVELLADYNPATEARENRKPAKSTDAEDKQVKPMPMLRATPPGGGPMVRSPYLGPSGTNAGRAYPGNTLPARPGIGRQP
jgi:type IV pilus assembly protein PilN